MPQIVNIAIDRLFPHSDNPRKDLGDLSELAASIKASGILQNLTVVPDEPDNSNTDFTIIIGHRRYDCGPDGAAVRGGRNVRARAASDHAC